MNNIPTPETDAFAIKFKTLCGEKYWVPVDIARKLERERDEARDISEKLSKQGLDMMDENRSLRQELDKAQDYSKDIWKIIAHSQDEVLRLTFENREVSQSIEGWENKWKCAVEMAARAELERDDAQEDAKLLAERLTALELESTVELARLEQELINMKELYESNN
jgi:hypothetical protein